VKNFHLHLVSDSTGETIMAVSRACLVQFENSHAIEHIWSMIRTERQLEKVLDGVKANPGLVLYTLVDTNLRDALEAACRKLRVPFHAVLDPVLSALSRYLHQTAAHLPGRQHALDAEYFGRIEAMDFAMAHDDGQQLHNLDKADVVLVGVSRTSKTPTSLYLANRGIRVANVPIVPGVKLPDELDHVRLNRLRMLNEKRQTTYVDPDAVKAEVTAARRLFSQRGWPVLDVTRRSIEETAAAILDLYNDYRAKRA
jgi:regulator of PEP synthase PpsR (kinase-PPPase family)